MNREAEAILWLDALCDGVLDLTRDNITLAQLIRGMLDPKYADRREPPALEGADV